MYDIEVFLKSGKSLYYHNIDYSLDFIGYRRKKTS